MTTFLRRAWAQLYAGFDDVAFDIWMLKVKRGAALKVKDIPSTLLCPTVVLAAHESSVVEDLEELVCRHESLTEPPPLHYFSFDASVFCLKYRRGEAMTTLTSPRNAQLIQNALAAWSR